MFKCLYLGIENIFQLFKFPSLEIENYCHFMFLEDIDPTFNTKCPFQAFDRYWPHMTEFHVMSLDKYWSHITKIPFRVDIGPILTIFKNLLNGSSGLVGPHLFQPFEIFELLHFEMFIDNDVQKKSFFLECFGVPWCLHKINNIALGVMDTSANSEQQWLFLISGSES